MTLLPRLLIIVTAAAIVFPLALWLSETVHMDCRRSSASQFECTFESSKRGATQLHQLDDTLLRRAALGEQSIYNTVDGTTDEKYYLELRLANGGKITSSDGDRDTIRTHVKAINAFLDDPAQRDMRFTMSNRNYRLALAALLMAVVVWGASSLR
ncbi:MAG: hypothetical protein JNL19_05635 [Burkholderiales bacterium]|nr:hypothetical protein [Burkholderiales bacterium]